MPAGPKSRLFGKFNPEVPDPLFRNDWDYYREADISVLTDFLEKYLR